MNHLLICPHCNKPYLAKDEDEPHMVPWIHFNIYGNSAPTQSIIGCQSAKNQRDQIKKRRAAEAEAKEKKLATAEFNRQVKQVAEKEYWEAYLKAGFIKRRIMEWLKP